MGVLDQTSSVGSLVSALRTKPPLKQLHVTKPETVRRSVDGSVAHDPELDPELDPDPDPPPPYPDPDDPDPVSGPTRPLEPQPAELVRPAASESASARESVRGMMERIAARGVQGLHEDPR